VTETEWAAARAGPPPQGADNDSDTVCSGSETAESLLQIGGFQSPIQSDL
jgi:hypothetical protein